MPRSDETPPVEVERYVREGMSLVPIVARQVRRQLGPSVDVAELESAGRAALFDAARSFDPQRGVPFRRWANLRVRGGMIDAVRSMGALPRRVYRALRAIESADRLQAGRLEDDAATPPRDADAADRRLDETLSGMAMAMATAYLAASSDGLERVVDDAPDPEAAVAEQRTLDALRKLIAERPEAERRLLEGHYFEGRTLDDVGRELGLSKSWASRLHARALAALAEEARRRL